MSDVAITIIIILAICLVIQNLTYMTMCAYYRAKYVRGTRNKFKRQIQEILERHEIYAGFVEEELTELISGEKELKSLEKEKGL